MSRLERNGRKRLSLNRRRSIARFLNVSSPWEGKAYRTSSGWQINNILPVGIRSRLCLGKTFRYFEPAQRARRLNCMQTGQQQHIIHLSRSSLPNRTLFASTSAPPPPPSLRPLMTRSSGQEMRDRETRLPTLPSLPFLHAAVLVRGAVLCTSAPAATRQRRREVEIASVRERARRASPIPDVYVSGGSAGFQFSCCGS